MAVKWRSKDELEFISETARLYQFEYVLVYGEEFDGDVLTVGALEFLVNNTFYDKDIYTVVPINEQEKNELDKKVKDVGDFE